jgi:hypothetical protein
MYERLQTRWIAAVECLKPVSEPFLSRRVGSELGLDRANQTGEQDRKPAFQKARETGDRRFLVC